jgi:hypothetical protein
MALERLEGLIAQTRATLQTRAVQSNLFPSGGCSGLDTDSGESRPHSFDDVVPPVLSRVITTSESAPPLEAGQDSGEIGSIHEPTLEPILERHPRTHRVTIHKPARTTAPPRAWEMCLELATSQYKPFQDQLGKSYRIAVQVRALALLSNPHADPRAMLPVFIPSIAALAHDLEWSESYVFRILAGKTPGSRRTEHRFKRGGKWREESKNADLELLMTWRPWFTDWACKAAGPSKRFAEGGRRTIMGGTVFYTRPQPSSDGLPKAVPAEWLKRAWRDLERDVSLERTARAIRAGTVVAKSCSVSKGTAEKGNGGIVNQYCYSSLTRFSTLPRGVVMDAELEGGSEIYAVLDMLSSEVERGHDSRTRYVDGLANRICYLLRDSRSLAFWRKTLWTLLKARIYGVTGALELVHGALWEVLIASSDNPLIKRPGALAVAAMQRNGWLEVEEAVAGLHAGRARA